MRKIVIISLLTFITVALISVLMLINYLLERLSVGYIMADLYNFIRCLSLFEAIALFYGILIASSLFVFGFYPSKRVAG